MQLMVAFTLTSENPLFTQLYCCFFVTNFDYEIRVHSESCPNNFVCHNLIKGREIYKGKRIKKMFLFSKLNFTQQKTPLTRQKP